jgi:hypothetical protein
VGCEIAPQSPSSASATWRWQSVRRGSKSWLYTATRGVMGEVESIARGLQQASANKLLDGYGRRILIKAGGAHWTKGEPDVATDDEGA